MNRLMLSRYLTKLGYQASLAQNGRQALDKLQGEPFDLVLLRARLTACLERKRLRDQEIDYLQQVGLVTAAAAAIKANTFQPESLDGAARRPDELGQLALVFQEMARQVYARQQHLSLQVLQLRIEIDQERRAREVADLTESDDFQQLLGKADELRNRVRADE
jgi:DNA-binding response OmpR family regulator